MVGGKSDINRNRGLWLEAERRSVRPGEGDLLLARRHCRHRRLRTVLREQAQRFQDGEGTDPVIDGARDDAPIGELVDRCIDHADAADAYALLSFSAIACADIDPQLLDLTGLGALVVFQEMDRLLTDHADHLALPTEEPHPLPDEHLRVPAAHSCERQKAIVVDIADHQPDLVDMAGQQHARRAALQNSEHIAAHIGADLIGEGGGLLAPDPGGRGLVAGWARRREQAFKELQRMVVHRLLLQIVESLTSPGLPGGR